MNGPQSAAPAMKQEGTSSVRPENSDSSAASMPLVPQRYQFRPPWKPVRLYSLASPTRGEIDEGGVRRPHLVSTTVKRTIDEHHDTHKLFLGVASNYLCDLHVGDEVKLTGPAGKRFLIPSRPGEHDYLFFATGTGIAPFRGMLIDLLEADVLAGAHRRDADPFTVPTNAAVGADAASLETIGILERREACRHFSV